MPLDDLIRDLAATWSGDAWYKRQALACLASGAFQLIPSRDGTELYLARFWLTPTQPAGIDGGRFESGSSMLLHHFVRGDDDGALHDHPWNFTSTVLQGGYTERRAVISPERHEPGLSFERAIKKICRPGPATIYRAATAQHAVEDVLPDTWTLVRTGERIRDWGFHPPGLPWVPWAEFLANKRAAGAA